MKNKRQVCLFGSALVVSSLCQASSVIDNYNALIASGRFFSALTAGVDFIRTNPAQHLTLIPTFSNYYTGHSNYKESGSLGIGMGIEYEPRQWLAWQAGLAAYFNTAVTAEGRVWQFGLPEFENFSYSYQLRSSRVVASGKLLGSFPSQRYSYFSHFHPYLSGEVGTSFNQAFSYSERPLLEEAVPMPAFSRHTRGSFSWGVGGGIDTDVNDKLRVGLGYQFVNLGRLSLGRCQGQETTETLGIKNFYTHQLRIQLTALI